MPDKTLKVVTYAAGASLAAITLIYVFGPTYFLDSHPSTSSSSGTFTTRKKGIVGLSNPANDCFINSVLQALAGLGDLRLYLIREVHRRALDEDSVYAQPVPPGALAGEETEQGLPRFDSDLPYWKLEGLQKGSVTKSLKEILDALNERPIYKKTISAGSFVRVLEEAFRQRVSRQQQDAQEFLQVVAERLCDEYHAGRRARLFANRIGAVDNKSPSARTNTAEKGDGARLLSANPATQCGFKTSYPPGRVGRGGVGDGNAERRQWGVEAEEGFPLEGRFESQIECLTCGFRPRPTSSTFCTLTLNVPHVSATTLGACFDGMFKTEHIDDFKCEKCRLLHAVALFESEMHRSTSEASRETAQAAVEALRLAIDTDPEKPPENVAIPDARYAPKRRIARHIRMTEFPKILAIHLSRSIFDASRSSQKNSAKVAFPEELRLGGLLQQRKYKLLGVVTHRGSHQSGHYESFRRQNVYPPFSNPSTFWPSEAYSRRASPASTPRFEAQSQPPEEAPTTSGRGAKSSTSPSSPSPAGSTIGSSKHSPCTGAGNDDSPTDAKPATSRSVSCDRVTNVVSEPATEASPRSMSPKTASTPSLLGAINPVPTSDQDLMARHVAAAKSKQRKQQARWWRISDDKVKEASTRDVLGMQREVYLLFYELERLHS